MAVNNGKMVTITCSTIEVNYKVNEIIRWMDSDNKDWYQITAMVYWSFDIVPDLSTVSNSWYYR